MCDELEFHCIYCQSLSLVEFPLYIPHAKQQQRCKSMKGKCLRTNSMHRPTYLKPSKNSPPLASIAEMEQVLEGKYSNTSSKGVPSHISNDEYLGGSRTI